MAEPIYLRVRRLLSASIEDAVDRMERAGGTAVMREAVREVDRALDEVRGEAEAATARKLQAVRQQRLLRDRAAGLVDKARFALEAERDDLAEAALSRQLDYEAQAERLDAVQAAATEEAERLEECATALATRKAEMEEALAAFEMAHRDAALGGGGPAQPRRSVERQVERAEKAFDRAMTGAGGAGFTRADGKAAAKVAEIDTIQRSAVIAQRMAELRAGLQAGVTPR
jgi:phage shock protein A